MSDDEGTIGKYRTLRLISLIVAGLVISNVAAAALFDRNQALGIDDLLATVVGVGLGLVVEFGVFRRPGRSR